MNWREQCGIVIPCLNEAASIGRVVTEARCFLSTVVVVDDGSSDQTATLASKAGAHVLRHSAPRGKGAALNTGLAWLETRAFSWALTMDGDGQHAPHDIPKFIDCAMRCDATLVIGNRMNSPREMPWLRRNVNRWLSRHLSRLSGQPLPDSQCGFRLFQLGAWAALDLQTSHFETESEMLLSFVAARQRVEFVPIEVIYKTEQSKIDPVRDSWRWLRWWSQARRSFAQAQSVDPADPLATPRIAANP